MTKYSVEEVREQAAKELRGGVYAKTWDMLNHLAERIEADERAVTEDIARKAYAALETEGDPIECMRKALLAVWPNPPAQAAQVKTPTEGHCIRVLSCDGEWEGEALWECGEGRYVTRVPVQPTAEPVAQGEEWAELRIGAPAWPGQREGKAPPEGWVHVSVNNLADLATHSPDAADSGRVGDDKKFPMTEQQVRQWLDACNHEPARQVLRDYLQLRAALAAQGEGDAAVAGYVDPEQLADMQRNGGGVSIGTFSERYGRTVPVYLHPAPAPAPPASPAGVPDGMVLVSREQLESIAKTIDDDGDEPEVAEELYAMLATAPSAPEGGEVV
jgi:hypothetical protein